MQYSEYTNQLKKQTNYTQTTNGAICLKSTLSDCVDFFYGTLKSKDQYYSLFLKALKENRETAIKILFWHRDIRSTGMGRRANFRHVLSKVDEWSIPTDFSLNSIFHYGRTDDMLSLLDTKAGKDVLKWIKVQLNGENNLVAKWLPRESSKKEKYKFYARRIARFLGWTPKQYRKRVGALTNVVEQKMVQQKWNDIDFSSVPSQATLRYKNCFFRNAGDNYTTWIQSLIKGDTSAKINTSTLDPHQIIDKYGCLYPSEEDQALEAMWKAIDKIESNALVIADTSGSMSGRPMAVSLSLALYFAERNPFSGFITFSSEPSWHTIDPNDSLKNKLEGIESINIQNTNLEATFDLLLDTYRETRMMPETLVIISDMQFDQAIGANLAPGAYRSNFSIDKNTFFLKMKEKFKNLNIPFPSIIFWNVSESTQGCPVAFDTTGTALISGYSPTIMQNIMDCKELNPKQIMMESISNINPNL